VFLFAIFFFFFEVLIFTRTWPDFIFFAIFLLLFLKLKDLAYIESGVTTMMD